MNWLDPDGRGNASNVRVRDSRTPIERVIDRFPLIFKNPTVCEKAYMNELVAARAILLRQGATWDGQQWSIADDNQLVEDPEQLKPYRVWHVKHADVDPAIRVESAARPDDGIAPPGSRCYEKPVAIGVDPAQPGADQTSFVAVSHSDQGLQIRKELSAQQKQALWDRNVAAMQRMQRPFALRRLGEQER
jgi:hypothetical protein